MTFEEQFPSLRRNYKIEEITMERLNGDSLPEARNRYSEKELLSLEHFPRTISWERIITIPIIDLQKHCLDKQKVREAIEKYSTNGYFDKLGTPCHDLKVTKEELLKELGL